MNLTIILPSRGERRGLRDAGHNHICVTTHYRGRGVRRYKNAYRRTPLPIQARRLCAVSCVTKVGGGITHHRAACPAVPPAPYLRAATLSRRPRLAINAR